MNINNTAQQYIVIMLEANKRYIKANLTNGVLHIQSHLVELYQSNLSNIGTQAALLCGFAFGAITLDFNAIALGEGRVSIENINIYVIYNVILLLIYIKDSCVFLLCIVYINFCLECICSQSKYSSKYIWANKSIEGK